MPSFPTWLQLKGDQQFNLEEALDELVSSGWIDAEHRETIPLTYEVTDTGYGWYLFHHHHMHVSINPLWDIVTSAELGPESLNRRSNGRNITSHIELDESLPVGQIDVSDVALILNGHTMLYAQPQDVRVSDFDRNGIPDLTVKFERQQVLASIGDGDVEMTITGLVDGLFFQENATLRVFGTPP